MLCPLGCCLLVLCPLGCCLLMLCPLGCCLLVLSPGPAGQCSDAMLGRWWQCWPPGERGTRPPVHTWAPPAPTPHSGPYPAPPCVLDNPLSAFLDRFQLDVQHEIKIKGRRNLRWFQFGKKIHLSLPRESHWEAVCVFTVVISGRGCRRLKFLFVFPSFLDFIQFCRTCTTFRIRGKNSKTIIF